MRIEPILTAAEQFTAGFEYVVRDVVAGMTWEASVDLATTPANKRPQSFCDGARAAANALSGWLDDARKLARAHGVDKVESMIANTRYDEMFPALTK